MIAEQNRLFRGVEDALLLTLTWGYRYDHTCIKPLPAPNKKKPPNMKGAFPMNQTNKTSAHKNSKKN